MRDPADGPLLITNVPAALDSSDLRATDVLQVLLRHLDV
jgi:hypothetical protein